MAMEQIKRNVANAHKLGVWDNERETRVTTDASDVGMGAILEQCDDSPTWLTIASWSKKLSSSQRRYSATDKEWLAVVECVTRVWRHWLLGKEFELRTDHGVLREILTKKGEDFTLRQ